MAFSKSTRILILLAIDSIFFLIELCTGYAVHSLALVADSFHMLNDVLSLCVGLWAVKVANEKGSSKMYTYGWQRAETLGALVNGVFLVALCLSIFLEAIQRFVEPQTVSNPQLILIVGSFGLLSNVMGLFLFHEHDHGHGAAPHAHASGDNSLANAEEGHGTMQTSTVPEIYRERVADQAGNIAEVLPQSAVAGLNLSGDATPKDGQTKKSSKGFTASDEDGSTITPHTTDTSLSPLSHRRSTVSSIRKDRRRHGSGSRGRFSSVDELHVHPASFRKEIIAAGRLDDIHSRSDTESGGESAVEDDPTESSPLLSHQQDSECTSKAKPVNGENGTFPHMRKRRTDSLHTGHNHRAGPDDEGEHGHRSAKKSGHSHGDLNMRGVFLHVMGDALGNIGVIASALFIWLTPFSWRFYADPLISLIITVIILASAIPLCKAASRILLQAVPSHISVDHIKADIESFPGIISCHHLHVWQLSDVKFVASLHIALEFDFKGEGSARYMQLARAIRGCLHEYGIHSSTIQPEFCLDENHQKMHELSGPSDDSEASEGRDRPGSGGANGLNANGKGLASKGTSKAPSLRSEANACLLECGDECGGASQQCCAPGPVPPGSDGHGH